MSRHTKNNNDTKNNNESPLLFQLPRSVLSFSDMSGNSFLMPVAVDNVAAGDNSVQSATNTPSVTEAAPVCQLQQPLLMRRESPGPRMSVPHSESHAQTANMESVQSGVSYSTAHYQPSTSDFGISSQSVETPNWPVSSAVGPPPPQSSTVYSGFQNQPPPPPQSEYVSQLNSFQPVSYSQENMDIGYQNVYPKDSAIPPVDNYCGENRVYMTEFPIIPGQHGEFFNALPQPPDYSSQPPLITPSTTTPVFQSNISTSTSMSQSQVPQVPFSNVPNSNVRSSEIYSGVYEPINAHWLFCDIVETKEVWYGFSKMDSYNLELAYGDPDAVVPVDGGRYDALLRQKIKRPVYFEGKDLQITRGTWFYRRGSTQRYIPFPEISCELLEQNYAGCFTSGKWQKRVAIAGIGTIVMESPQILLYYRSESDIFPTLPDSKGSPQPVRRGLPENFEIMADESDKIDHLVFIVQGIGSFCDLRFRTVAECVDGVRDIANKLIANHFRKEHENGQVGRVEFLPLAWHAQLHTSDKGFDRCMQNITLPSIPKLRHFTNDTLLDILLYSSPTYCQSIIDTVASELNKLYEIFLRRNPDFCGSVFVAGHSLGSLILFDILANQTPNEEGNSQSDEPSKDMPSDVQESKSLVEPDDNKVPCESNIQELYDSLESLLQKCQLEEYKELLEKEKIDLSSVSLLSNDDLKDIGLPTGPRKKLLNAIHPNNQKSDDTGDVSVLPSTSVSATSTSAASPNQETSKKEMQDVSDVHHSLEFPAKKSPCMASIKYPKLHFEPASFFALGSPISMFLTVRGYELINEDFRFPTCPGFFHIFHPYDPVAFRIEPLIDPTFTAKPVLIPHHKGRKRMHLEIRENLSKVGSEIKQKVIETLKYTWDSLNVFAKAHTFSAAVEAEVDKIMKEQITDAEFDTQAPSETSADEIQIGALNGGRRIDYVLQEKPIEALNDYIFALTSHATYWDSEDTVLMILREIYATQGITLSTLSLDTKYYPSEKSFQENKLNSAMSNPTLYQSCQPDYESTKASSYFNLDANDYKPPRRSLQTAAESQASYNVPPHSTSVQPVLPIFTQFSQPVGIPSTSTSKPLSASISQPIGLSSISTPQPPPTSASQTGPPPASQPVGPPPASQPVGPPPLTGFVKRSPFTLTR